MWLGFSAAFIGILYALVKFATALRLRRLHQELAQAQYDVRKIGQRIEAVQEQLEIERSKKQTLERETARLRQSVEKRYARLQALLPQAMMPRLERCRALRAEPAGGDLKLLQDLDLLEEIDRALEPISLLFVHLPGNPEGGQIALARLVELLEAEQIHFHGPEDEMVVSLFPRPREAIDLFLRFVEETPAAHLRKVRAGLYAGVELSGEERVIHRLLIRSLRKGRRLLQQAPAGGLLMNEEAHRALEDLPDARPFDAEEPAYLLSWQERGAES